MRRRQEGQGGNGESNTNQSKYVCVCVCVQARGRIARHHMPPLGSSFKVEWACRNIAWVSLIGPWGFNARALGAFTE